MPLTETTTERALVFDGRHVVLGDRHLEPLKPNQVRLRAEFTHVSIGTEIAYIDEYSKSQKPSGGLGYSFVGVIEELGAEVRGWNRGQRVLTFANHASATNVTVEPGALVPVPDGLNPDKAALAVLGSIAYHVVQRAAPKMLETTVVLGQGVVGSLIAQVARFCGVDPIVVDTDAGRLRVAREIGFQTVDATREDAIARVKELTGGKGATLCIEAATNAKAIDNAMKMLALRGRLVLTSTIFEPVPFHILGDFIERELTVIGAHQPKCPIVPNEYYFWNQVDNRTAAMLAMRDDRLKVEHLISHRVKPQEAPALYERLRAKDRSIVGMVIDWTQ
jgi:2-desacetyl-2-hydroxyethyl bacteriochlorophyllide A dehydrogenase